MARYKLANTRIGAAGNMEELIAKRVDELETELEKTRLRLRQSVSKSNRRKSALKQLMKRYDMEVTAYRNAYMMNHNLNDRYNSLYKAYLILQKQVCKKFHLF